jgi:V-type H+-transporting ATPase subunit a
MFGDIGHGSILFLFGLALVFFHDKFKNGALAGLAAHRYTLALMGFFALYCGFIYNDYVSINLNLFGSCYQINKTSITHQ